MRQKFVEQIVEGFPAKVKHALELFDQELPGAKKPDDLPAQIACLIYMAYAQALATDEPSAITASIRKELCLKAHHLGIDAGRLSASVQEVTTKLGGTPTPGELARHIVRSWVAATGNEGNIDVFKWAVKIYVVVYLELTDAIGTHPYG